MLTPPSLFMPKFKAESVSIALDPITLKTLFPYNDTGHHRETKDALIYLKYTTMVTSFHKALVVDCAIHFDPSTSVDKVGDLFDSC